MQLREILVTMRIGEELIEIVGTAFHRREEERDFSVVKMRLICYMN